MDRQYRKRSEMSILYCWVSSHRLLQLGATIIELSNREVSKMDIFDFKHTHVQEVRNARTASINKGKENAS